MNSKAKGELSEGIVLAYLLKKGYSVSIPFGNNQRYDFILDEGGKLLKVQCKTARFTNGCVCFSVASVNGFNGKRTTYAGQEDLFLVYCPQTDAVYRFPAEEAGKSAMYLRVDKNRGGATSKIKWAKDYMF